MDLRQLRYLVALAEELNFTRAAAAEHIAQPALSQQIRRLEEEVGVGLVERTTRKVALTEAGELLAVRARRILAELEIAREELEALRGKPSTCRAAIVAWPGPQSVTSSVLTVEYFCAVTAIVR